MYYYNNRTTWLLPFIILSFAFSVFLYDTNTQLFLFINKFLLFSNEIIWSNITILGDTLVAIAILFPFCVRRPKYVILSLRILVNMIIGIIRRLDHHKKLLIE